MSKIDKKRKKLSNRLIELENNLKLSLTKKASNTDEIDVDAELRKIRKVKEDLINLK